MIHSRFEVGRKKAVNRTAGERQRLAHKVKREMKVCNHLKLLPHFLSSLSLLTSLPHLPLPAFNFPSPGCST